MCAYHVKVEGRDISLKLRNRHHMHNYRIVSLHSIIVCVRSRSDFYALSHYPLAFVLAVAFRTIGKFFNRLGSN